MTNFEISENSSIGDYQKEQIVGLQIVRRFLNTLTDEERNRLLERTDTYRMFRAETDLFLSTHFSRICISNCYENQLSACCSKEGIITFFADVVINTLVSEQSALDGLETRLSQPNPGVKCVYLGKDGCRWKIKPIVCQMFLCGKAEEAVFQENPEAGRQWEILKRRRNDFTWPDRPVLFDELESFFMDAGYSSTLMYFHYSPGLMRVKRRAGLISR